MAKGSTGSWPRSGPIPALPNSAARVGRGVLRRWPIVVVVTLLTTVGILTLAQLVSRDATYTATATVAIHQSVAKSTLTASNDTVSLNRDMANWFEFAQSDQLRSVVETRIDGPLGSSGPELEDNVDALSMVGNASTSQRAADIANAWADAFVETATEDVTGSLAEANAEVVARRDELFAQREVVLAPFYRLRDELEATTEPTERSQLIREIDTQSGLVEAELDVIDAELRVIADNLARLGVTQLVVDEGVASVSRRAVPSETSSGRGRVGSGFAALSVGLLVGVGLAALLARADQRVLTLADAQATGLHAVGEDSAAASTIRVLADAQSYERVALVGIAEEGGANHLSELLTREDGVGEIVVAHASDPETLEDVFSADTTVVVAPRGVDQRNLIRAARLVELGGGHVLGVAIVGAE